jgi:hypothetical protein
MDSYNQEILGFFAHKPEDYMMLGYVPFTVDEMTDLYGKGRKSNVDQIDTEWDIEFDNVKFNFFSVKGKRGVRVCANKFYNIVEVAKKLEERTTQKV